MPEIAETARAFKMWRDLLGLNQKDLAALVGIHHSTISDYENGKASPQADTIARVTATLGMTPVDREQAEIFIHNVLPRLQAAVAKTLPTTPPREVSAWRTQAAQVTHDGVRFLSGLLFLLFDLLISNAEAVGRRGDSNPEADP